MEKCTFCCFNLDSNPSFINLSSWTNSYNLIHFSFRLSCLLFPEEKLAISQDGRTFFARYIGLCWPFTGDKLSILKSSKTVNSPLFEKDGSWDDKYSKESLRETIFVSLLDLDDWFRETICLCSPYTLANYLFLSSYSSLSNETFLDW